MVATMGPGRSRHIPLAAGIEFRSGAVLLAVVGPPGGEVVALARTSLADGVVIGGTVRQPDAAAAAVRTLIDGIHWRRPPSVAVVAAPADSMAFEGVLAEPVMDGPGPGGEAAGTRASGDGAVPTGDVVRADRREVATLQNAAARIGLGAFRIDSLPLAVVRFARRAHPELDLVFARGASAGRRWTVSAAPEGIDVESYEDPDDGPILIGADLGELREPSWGQLPLARPVARRVAEPGPWLPAVGAALASAGFGPRVDFGWSAATSSPLDWPPPTPTQTAARPQPGGPRRG